MKITFQHLKQEAELHGFPIVGIIKPHYFTDLKDKLTKYVAEGYTFEFNKKNVEEKCDPFLTMKNCKTIIVLGLPYYINSNKQNEVLPKGKSSFRGKLARTARGEDYHRVFQRKMKNLGEALQKDNSEIQYQSYVDTGPLVDRYLASKAGLGFYGYNNLFYHHQYGSFVFYGYMLIDQEMDCQEINNQVQKTQLHYRNLCKNCNRCIKACPGKAIENPYRLNASRCVSGVLQKKGILSDEEKSIISDGIYGCDVCQEVCPYNKDIKFSLDPAFIPTDPPAYPDLIELLGFSNKEFKKVYGNNASAWRGSRVLKRNALIVLGHSENPKAIPYILPFTENSSEDLRDAACWAVKKITKHMAE